MKNAEAVLSVKFNTTFSSEKLNNVCKEDLESFRAVPGLIQKYYLIEESTGAISGVYLFETEDDSASFLTSELAKAIPTRYGVIPETLHVEQYNTILVLNDVVLA